MKYGHAFNAGERYRVGSDGLARQGEIVEFVSYRGYNFYPSCRVRAVSDGREFYVSPTYLEECNGEAYS